MSVRVRIPTPLRPLTGGRSQVTTNGTTVAEVIGELAAEAPELRAQLLSDDGRLRSFVNLYLNGEDVRSRSGLDTALADGDEIAIVPAIAGGSPR
jgi:MoaD family protein